ELTPEERIQNSLVGTDIGLGVVSDGLEGYWHYKNGIKGDEWKNLSPTTTGKSKGIIYGATLHEDGLYFNGADDSFEVQSVGLGYVNQFTLEMTFDMQSMKFNSKIIGFNTENTIENVLDSYIGFRFANTLY